MAQAHKQGVIHGDLKPGNVILAKTPEGGPRAVITDFGLAKFALPDGSPVASPPGGTRDYMAPELFLDERASVASDIYALGIMFHTMLAGNPPPRLSDLPGIPIPRDATTKTLAAPGDPAIWERKLESLPRPWAAVVAKCIDPLASRRFASAREVSEALSPSQPKRSQWPAAAAAAGLLLIAGGGYWWQSTAPAGPPIRLAVLPIQMTGEPIPGMNGVASDVADRLSGARRNFSVISPQTAQQSQVDSPEKAKSVLGATHVLETHLTTSAGHTDADVRLVDMGTGEALRSSKSRYDAVDAAILARVLIGSVTGAFNLKSQTGKDEMSKEAYPAYTQGTELLTKDLRNADQALVLFEKAASLDPKSATVRAHLAMAQLQRFINGDGAQWLPTAEMTAKAAAALDPDSFFVLMCSGLVGQYKGDYEGAIAAFTRMTTIDPASATGWRLLAEIYRFAGRENDAISTFQKAIATTPNQYESYLNFGNLYVRRADYVEAARMYGRVTALAPGLASGHMNLGLAFKQLGRYAEAEQELLKALALRPSPRLMINIGALYYEQERYAEALRYFQDGAKQGALSAALARNLGDAYRHLGRPKEAADSYRKAKLLSEDEVKANPRSGVPRARMALLSALLGDAHTAEFELSQAISVEPANKAVTGEAVKTYEVLKERDKALGLLEHAPAGFLQELSRQPDLKALQKDPRFQEFVRSSKQSDPTSKGK